MPVFSAAYVGSDQVQRMYLGSTLIYELGSGDPTVPFAQVRASFSTNFSITASTPTDMNFDLEIYDENWSYSGSGGLFVVPNGITKIIVIAHIEAATAVTATNSEIAIFRNGSRVISYYPEAELELSATIRHVLSVGTGDTIKIVVTTGQTTTVQASRSFVNILGYS